MASIQEAVNRSITTGAAFLIASAMAKEKTSKSEKPHKAESASNEQNQKMMDALKKRNEEAEQARKRSEEFRKRLTEGVYNPKERL